MRLILHRPSENSITDLGDISHTGGSNTSVDSPNVSGGYKNIGTTSCTITQLSLDYLTTIYKFENHTQFKDKMDFLSDYLDDVIVWGDSKSRDMGRWFTETYRTVRGGTIGCNILDDGSIDCIVVLTGQVLAGTRPEQLVRCLLHLYKYFVTCTRLDIALDDSTAMLPRMRDSARAAWAENMHSGFKKYGRVDSGSTADQLETTHYWGTRNGDRIVRIYDKQSIKCTRFEVENKRRRALEGYMHLTSCLMCGLSYKETLTRLFHFSITGIEFYEGEKDKNLGRNKIAQFWQDFKDQIQFEKISMPKLVIDTSIQKSQRWVEKQVAASLAAIRAALGEGFHPWFADTLMKGKERINPRHKAEIDTIKREQKENWLDTIKEKEKGMFGRKKR